MNYDIKRKLEKLNIAVVELQDTESENHKKIQTEPRVRCTNFSLTNLS